MSESRHSLLDVAIVGSGPNGLAAAVTLARAGLSVEVFEGMDEPGGGCRTEELTLPGFRHDVCSTIQSMIPLSPFFQSLDLAELGVRLRTPEVALAHPLDDGRAATLVRSVPESAAALGVDSVAYAQLLGPLVDDAESLMATVLAPLRSLPPHPVTMARFAASGLVSAERLCRRFSTDETRGLLAGLAAHSMLPLDAPVTSAFGLLLGVTAHATGWPVIETGTDRLVVGLATALGDAGGVIHPGRWITDMQELPRARATIFDTSPETLVTVAGDRVPARYRRGVARFKHGPGICKVDWALSGPVPWQAEAVRKAGTVHLGGRLEQILRAEADVSSGRHPDDPFVIAVQASVIDATRAPADGQTLWAYCHVPRGSTVDVTERIESQIERFAPGFRDLVLARSSITAAGSEVNNPNYVGGDISGGAPTLRQIAFRPTVRWNPYKTGAPGLYLCSSSTPPGAGVHGMCGAGAAQAVLADLSRRSRP